MSQDHPAYRKLQLPSDAPFELRPSPGKGWGAFATRPIERGALILRDAPLFVIPKPPSQIIGDDLFGALLNLSPRERQQFQDLRENGSRPFEHALKAFRENYFTLRNETCCGLFLLQSRFNHSCVPNSEVPPDNGSMILSRFASRDIKAGEEITFCYIANAERMTRHDRHRAFRLVCDCKACLPGTAFQQLSEMRRTLIRGLEYLRCGADFDGQRHPSGQSIIIDPELKKAAEDRKISIPNKFFLTAMVMFLMEEESILGHYVFGAHYISYLAKLLPLFLAESNTRIAWLALGQKTVGEMLSVAIQLYGRPDVLKVTTSRLAQTVRETGLY